MNKSGTNLTKLCSSCGQRKPLSAFLQVAGSHSYGNICASCRKTALADEGREESTRSTTGAKIDAKTKVKEAADKREALKQIEENYFDERDQKEETSINRKQKIAHASDKEKMHRKNFLEKHSFLDNKKSATAAPVFGGEAQKTAAGKLDFKAGTGDLTRVAQIKTQSSVYQTFKTWLGNAPIVSAAEKAAKQKHANKTAAAPDAGPELKRGPGYKK